MIGEWFIFALVTIAAAGVFFLPGVVIGRIVRLRGLGLFAFAPVVTAAASGVLAVLLEKLTLPWNPLTFAGAVAVIATITAILRRWSARPLTPESTSAKAGWWLPLGIALGAVLISIRLLVYLQVPDAVSQTNDAVFHLNALRYVLETQSASSLTISGVLGASSFYPAAWHGVVALVIGITGASIPVAVNAVSLVIAVMVWPLGIAWFTRTVTGSHATAGVAAVLSASMVHFPMLMLQWGVLYPNELAIALLPAGLACVLDARGRGTSSGQSGWASAAFLGIVAVAGLGFSQPVAVLTWVMLLACFCFVRFSVQGARPRVARIIIGAAIVLTFVLIWWAVARVAGGAHWGPYGNWVEAVVELLLTAQVDLPPMPILSALAVLGLIAVAIQPRLRWLGIAWATLAILMGIATSVANADVRHWVLGPWYADPYRIAATLPVITVPLMAVGLIWGAERLRSLAPGFRRVSAETLAFTVGLLISAGILIAAPVVQMPMVTEGIHDQRTRYAIDDDTYLSTDERRLIQQLPDLVPDGSLLIGNPSTGMGFAFALSGVDTIPKTWSPPGGEEWALVARHLRDAGSQPQVCNALDSLGRADYVLDFGLGETTAGRFEMPGLTEFAGQDGFTLVAREGQASLWRITACD